MRWIAITSSVLLLSSSAIGHARAEDARVPTGTSEPVSQDYRWYANIGISGILFDSSSDIWIFDDRVDGADAELTDEITPTVELGYYLTPNFSLALSLGLPPKSDFEGRGVFDGLLLGSVTFGTVIGTAKYHLTNFGDRFKPYVGGGAAYTIILSDTDAALRDFEVDGEFGGVVQAGAEFAVTDRQNLFVDVKKVFLGASGTGTTFDPASGYPLPARAEVDLDPIVVTAGVGFRF